jgi:glucose dehydrogenase
MYLDTPGGGVVALDAATGAVKWKGMPSDEVNGFGGVNQHRGVSVGEGRVYTTAAGSRVIALDQKTGVPVWAVQPTHDGEVLAGISKVHTLYHDGLVYMGTNDNARGAAFALRASDGALPRSGSAADKGLLSTLDRPHMRTRPAGLSAHHHDRLAARLQKPSCQALATCTTLESSAITAAMPAAYVYPPLHSIGDGLPEALHGCELGLLCRSLPLVLELLSLGFHRCLD